MADRRRLLRGAVLSIGLTLGCFVLGMFVAGRCCVPPGSGLAAAGIVIGYGALAGIGGLISGVVLGMALPVRVLGPVAVGAGVLGTVVMGSLIAVVLQGRSASRAHLQEAYDRLPAFTLNIAIPRGAPESPFERFSVDWGRREVVIVAGATSCRASLDGPQGVAFLSAVRAAEGVLYAEPQACADDRGEPSYSLTFEVLEALPPPTRGDVSPGESCLQLWPALDAPMAEARRQLRVLLRRCQR
jgi:hypothetical protein